MAQESFQYQAFVVQRINFQFSLSLYVVSMYIRGKEQRKFKNNNCINTWKIRLQVASYPSQS
jgi:hypothetical protein